MVTLKPRFRLPSPVSPVVPIAAEYQSLFGMLVVTFTDNLTPGVAAGAQFAGVALVGGSFRELVMPQWVTVLASRTEAFVSLGGVVAGPARLDYTPGPFPLLDAGGLPLAAWSGLPVATT